MGEDLFAGIEAYEKKWDKEIGKGIFGDATSILDRNEKIIPVSPAIDAKIGGIPDGTWNIFSGPEKSGKSTTALQIAANAQELYNKPVAYIDVEGRLAKKNLTGVHNLNLDPKRFRLVQSTPTHILTAEDNLNICMDLLKGIDELVLIIDSASALCAASESEGGITAQARNNGPKLLASFCRQMGNVVPVRRSTVIIIQHLIANTSGYGSPFMEDGGNKIKYQVDTKLRCKGFSKWLDSDEVQIGQMVKWEVVCCAMGPPGAKIESYLRYGHGLDDTKEVMEMAIDFGLVKKAGSWYSIQHNEEEIKVQGTEKLYSAFKENKELYNSVYETVKQML